MIEQQVWLEERPTVTELRGAMNKFLVGHPTIRAEALTFCIYDDLIVGGFIYTRHMKKVVNDEVADMLRALINDALGGLDVQAEINLCTVNGIVYAGNSNSHISDDPQIATWVDAMNILLSQSERVNTRWGYNSKLPIYELPEDEWDEPTATKSNGRAVWIEALKMFKLQGCQPNIEREEDHTRIYHTIGENGELGYLWIAMVGDPVCELSSEELSRILEEPGTWSLA